MPSHFCVHKNCQGDILKYTMKGNWQIIFPIPSFIFSVIKGQLWKSFSHLMLLLASVGIMICSCDLSL